MSLLARDHGIDSHFGAKHYKLTRAGCRPYTIPAHNGLKSVVRVEYLRGLCDHFGIDRSVFGLEPRHPRLAEELAGAEQPGGPKERQER